MSSPAADTISPTDETADTDQDRKRADYARPSGIRRRVLPEQGVVPPFAAIHRTVRF